MADNNNEPHSDLPGLILRDLFAAATLIGLLSKGMPIATEVESDATAKRCYRMADAMLETRQE